MRGTGVAVLGVATLIALSAASLSAVGSQGSSCRDASGYCPSVDQVRVDQSLSDIPIDASIAQVRDQLTIIDINGCARWGECEWYDRHAVRHYFFEGHVTVKTVIAREFEGQPISALGVGSARSRHDVLANVRAFLPGIAIECRPPTGRYTKVCGEARGSHKVTPGWLRIGFDADDQLLEIRFDGYHFI